MARKGQRCPWMVSAWRSNPSSSLSLIIAATACRGERCSCILWLLIKVKAEGIGTVGGCFRPNKKIGTGGAGARAFAENAEGGASRRGLADPCLTGPVSRLPPQERRAIAVEPLAPLPVVWEDRRHLAPKAGIMSRDPQMGEFMHHHVIDDLRRQHDQPPVEAQAAVRVAFAPAPLPLRQLQRPRLNPQGRGITGQPSLNIRRRPAVQPISQGGPTAGRQIRQFPDFLPLGRPRLPLPASKG